MGLYIGSSNVAGGGSVTDSSVAAFIGAGGPTDTALSATYARRSTIDLRDWTDFDPTGVNDNAAVLAAAVAQAVSGDTILIPPRSVIATTAPWVIDKSMRVEGGGVYAPYDSLNTTFSFDLPAPISGSVIVQTTAATDGIQLTKAGAHVDLRNLGVRFDGAHRFTNTGHGVNATPSTTYSSGHDHGMMNSTWDKVMVYGHDGNHYAAQLTNPLLNTIRGLRSWGGGVLRVLSDSYAGNYGNLVMEHPYGLLLAGGTAHGYSLESRTSSGTSGVLNLVTMIRPQCNSSATAGGAGVAATNSQYLFRADSPASTSGLAIINPDLECGSGLTNPVSFGGGNTFVDPSGIFGQSTDQTSKAFTVFRSTMGAKRLNSDLSISDVNSSPALTTVTILTGSGTGTPTVTISGDDMRGTVTVVMGTAPTAFSDLFRINFGQISSFTTCILFPGNGNAAVAQAYRRSAAAASVTFGTGVAPTAGGTYVWNYQTIR